MFYLLLTTVGVVLIAVLLWRTLVPARTRVGVGARRRTIGPDDDPDFLRLLGEQNRRPDADDGPADE